MYNYLSIFMGFSDNSAGKEIHLQSRPRFSSWLGKLPWRRDRLSTQIFLGFPGGSDGNNLPAMWETRVRSWIGKILWRAWQPTPEFLPEASPWTEEPGGLQSMRPQRVGQDWATMHGAADLSLHTCAQALKSCPTLCDPMDCSLPGYSAHELSQTRILESVAISSSRGSSKPRNWTRISCIGRRILYHWATREAPSIFIDNINCILLGLFLWRTLTNIQNSTSHTGWPYYFRLYKRLETILP